MSDEGKEIPLLESEGSQKTAEAFTKFTGIKTLQGPEINSAKAAFAKAADGFLNYFVEKGLIAEEEKGEILAGWENAIALDRQGLERYSDFATQIYKQAVTDLSGEDPNQKSGEAQMLIQGAGRIVEERKRLLSRGSAFVCRPDQHQAARAKAVGLPKKWIMINWGNKEEFLGHEEMVQGIAYEETGHLLSKMGEYGGSFRQGWVEEMMSKLATYMAFPSYIADNEGIKEGLRFSEYAKLYYLIADQVGDEAVLLRAFFGKEPTDSKLVKKADVVLGEMSLIGNLVNSGSSLDKIFEYLRKN